MPAPLKVPTIFTAVDRVTGVVQRMQRSVGGFAGKASIGINALNTGINRLIPSFGRLAKQAVGIGAGYAIFQGLSAGGSAIIDFEKNVAGLRVILNDLSDSQFGAYEKGIIQVAKATRMSAVDVAASFEKIAELNYDLAKTPDGLARLSTSAITLARAARIELTPATEGLIAIMSQFDLPATQAERLSNALAAGFKYGSASIEDQIESYRGFGTVAKEANVTMEQSIALTQTLAKYQLKGSEAGTALRSAIIHLQNAGAGYKSGKFSLNDALDEMRTKLASLKNDMKRDAFLNALFGIRAVTQGRLLGRSGELMNDLARNVTGTNEAFKQAAITTETFASKWEQLKGSIATYLVSNDSANAGLDRLKGIIVYVTNNLDKIIDRIITFGKILLWLKGIIYAVQAALFIYNTYMGIMGAVTGVANIAIGQSTVALAAYRSTLLITGGATAAFGSSTAALSGGMATVTGSFVAANGAAAGFFATLGSFVLPAALVGLAGYMAYKGIKEATHFAPGRITSMKPVLSAEEQKRQDALDLSMKSKTPGFTPFVPIEQRKKAAEYTLQPGLDFIDIPRGSNRTNQTEQKPVRVEVVIQDTNGAVKDVRVINGKLLKSQMPIKMTPTTGIK